MIQGTTSDAGKSALVTALCRVLHRRGMRVAPFKPQNMALNSAVTRDGGEIGRAQAVQAAAACIQPHSDMNPLLLKPNTDCGCQLILQGAPHRNNMDAWGFHDYKSRVMPAVLESYHRLGSQYDYILVEGAGSPAEINLREGDVANMGFAESVDCPVILVADIDRGGVFAHIVGTLSLLSRSEQSRVAGFVINRFRGDKAILKPGTDWLEQQTGKPLLGVLPYLQGLHLEAEDSLADHSSDATAPDAIRVVIPDLPRKSNHTDFDPLRLHPQVELIWARAGNPLPPGDLIVLPGSKSVRSDLEWLQARGWEAQIRRHLRYGGKLLGICGGFQMLGEWLHDPEGIEGDPGSSPGLALLQMETRLLHRKQLRLVTGQLTLDRSPVEGYEIHMGDSRGLALEKPLVNLGDGSDGALSEDGQVAGTYLHGLFENTQACDALLRWAGLSSARSPDYRGLREAGINLIADTVEAHLDMERILAILEGSP